MFTGRRSTDVLPGRTQVARELVDEHKGGGNACLGRKGEIFENEEAFAEIYTLLQVVIEFIRLEGDFSFLSKHCNNGPDSLLLILASELRLVEMQSRIVPHFTPFFRIDTDHTAFQEEIAVDIAQSLHPDQGLFQEVENFEDGYLIYFCQAIKNRFNR